MEKTKRIGSTRNHGLRTFKKVHIRPSDDPRFVARLEFFDRTGSAYFELPYTWDGAIKTISAHEEFGL